MKNILRSVAVLAIAAATSACASSPGPDTDGRLFWMVGCWQSADGANRTVWSTSESGAMFGHATVTDAGGGLSYYEQARIMLTTRPGTYVVSPNGQRAATFVENPDASPPGAGAQIVFENSANEFPQRVAYRAVGKDGLSATVSAIDGSRSTEYAWSRCKS